MKAYGSGEVLIDSYSESNYDYFVPLESNYPSGENPAAIGKSSFPQRHTR
jgi:hypothetical protein